MGYDITRQNLGWTLVFFTVFLLLFWGRSVVCPVAVEALPAGDMPLGVLLDWLFAGWPVAADAATLLLVFWNGILLARIVSRNMILVERTYMPVVLYLIVGCGSYFGGAMFSAAVASLLMILSFDLMLLSFRRVVQYGTLFNAAIVTGMALLVTSHAAVYVLLLPVSLVLFKKGWRDWIIAWVGLLLPLAVCSYVYWGMGYPFGHVAGMLGQAFADGFSGGDFLADALNPALLVFWGAILTVTVLSCITFWQRASTMRTRAYKSFVYFLWTLLFSALLFVWPGRSPGDFLLIAAPLAVVVPAYFNRRSGWIPDLVYALLLGSAAAYNLIGMAGC